MHNKLLAKTFAVLEYIAESPEPVELRRLSEALGIPRSTLSRLLQDLTAAGYVSKCGYHRFESALGMVALGQNALSHSFLSRGIFDLMVEKQHELKVGVALGGIFQESVFYFFRTAGADSGETEGIPYRCPPSHSGIARLILALTAPPAEALRQLNADQQEPALSAADLAGIAAAGYCVFRQRGLNIIFPVNYRGRVYGLSFFGIPADSDQMEKLLFECSLLAARITRLLNN